MTLSSTLFDCHPGYPLVTRALLAFVVGCPKPKPQPRGRRGARIRGLAVS